MLLAFHNDKKIKSKFTRRLKAHHKADELIRGTYWDRSDNRGCAVGCTLHKSEGVHAAYETELGIPRTIAYLEDRIFESLLEADAPQFAVDFLEAVPVGADLSLVTARFMVWMLADETDGVITHFDHACFPEVKAAIEGVVELYERLIDGGTVIKSEWQSVAPAACAAYAADAAADAAACAAACAAADAAYAADAAADAAACAAACAAAYAAYAADAAADAAACAAACAAAYTAYAAYAAYAAAYAAACAADAAACAAYAAACAAFWRKAASKLLELIRSAPVPPQQEA